MIKRKLAIGCLATGLLATGYVVEREPVKTLTLTAQNWTLNADGKWLTVVQATNNRSRVNFSASVGEVISVPIWIYNNENVVKVVTDTPSALTVTATADGKTRVLNLPSPNDRYSQPLQFTARAIGPHLASLGFSWLNPANPAQQYQIWRTENSASEKLIGLADGSSVTFKDNGVMPNNSYQYRLVALANSQPVKAIKLAITTPSPLIKKSLVALSGKGIIIYIDPTDPKSQFFYKVLTPEDIISDSKRLEFRYIQLRTVYGAYSHFTNPDVQKWLARLLDLAAENNIKVISWSIPRHNSVDAIAEDVTVAAFTTPSGNTFAGCALDLETGSDYMGQLPQAKDNIANFAKTFRQAVGPNYLVSAIVFTPWQTGYDNTNYPYKELAEHVDVMQPMEFWHHYFVGARHIYSLTEVTNAITNAIAMTKLYAGKDIPINVIGQSINLDGTGLPSKEEIDTALIAAKNSLAIGVSFFAWFNALINNDSTLSDQAQAMENFMW